MQKVGEVLVFSPSDLCRFMESAFVTWMDRFHLEVPGQFQPDDAGETEKLLQERGLEHERAFLKQLELSGHDICDISKAQNKFDATAEALRSGREIVYQAALRDGEFAGYADFLIRVDGKSSLGSHHYEPWDTKLGLHAKPYYLLQLACYADLLSQLQEKVPTNVHVVLGNKETLSLRTQDYLFYYIQVRKAFLEHQRSFDPSSPPDFSGFEEFGRWASEAERRITESDHLCRVANMRRVQIRKLHLINVRTMHQLASLENTNVPGMKETTLSTLRHQAQLQIASFGVVVPKFDLISCGEGKGLVNLPPFSEMDIYFDMEGYPFADGGLEYLFGATIVEKGEMKFRDWWAHDCAEEKKAFEDFIDWAHGRWSANPSMHIYHYASYEKTALRKLMGRYGTRESELDDLLRSEVFVDLLPIVRQSVRIGQPNYSIKSVEQLYREKRHGDVATAIDSVVFYKKWLDHKDGDSWKNSPMLAEIRSYNKEDCDSTYQLTQWLRTLQRGNGIHYIAHPSKIVPDSSGAETRSKAAALAREMLAGIPTDENEWTERQRVQVLLSQLLEFHWREAKPVFWAKYDRHAMTEEELFEDSSCIAGLAKSGARPRLSHSKRSVLYEYDFDPEQDTKVDAGANCFYAHDLHESIGIESIDTQGGKITLKRSREKPPPPNNISLILDDFVDASAIAESIYRIAEQFSEGHELTSALKDLLLRRQPRINGWSAGAILPDDRDIAEGAVDVISRMDNTTLSIQGPPGSGKTYTSAKAIASLMRAGKRVGVTSNSHKAIAKLLDEVAKLIGEDRSVRIAKVQSDEADFEVTGKRVYKLEPKPFFDKGRDMFSCVGGTAWLFSDSRAGGLCDYLFVDEAGQVSLANLVAMSRCTSNIVLIGDQMQLAQPVKGSHPGESGKSTLEYLLRDQQVIGDDLGVFLRTTRRMHPDLCAFISDAVYEGRLHAHPDTAKRFFAARNDEVAYVNRSAGLVFVPVDHDGNTQDSEEEANVIIDIVNELQRCNLIDKDVSRPIEPEDIMIVAPYNMQVRRIRNYLPGFQVGSVDKFQGQEAPVVIVSMCASSGESLSRGIEFLFSKNRLNVAISRAQILAVVVGNPRLAGIRCTTIAQMELVNLYCRILETADSRTGSLIQSLIATR